MRQKKLRKLNDDSDAEKGQVMRAKSAQPEDTIGGEGGATDKTRRGGRRQAGLSESGGSGLNRGSAGSDSFGGPRQLWDVGVDAGLSLLTGRLCFSVGWVEREGGGSTCCTCLYAEGELMDEMGR